MGPIFISYIEFVIFNNFNCNFTSSLLLICIDALYSKEIEKTFVISKNYPQFLN